MNLDRFQQKNRLKSQLKPYEPIIMRLEEILFGEQPILLIFAVIVFNSVLIFAHVSDMGVISLLTLYGMIIYSLYFLNAKFNIFSFVNQIVPVENANVDRSKLRSFDEVCDFLVTFKEKSEMAIDYLLGNQFKHISKIIYVFTLWFTLAFVFNIIGNFWLLLILFNISLLTPGFNILVLIFNSISQIIELAINSQGAQQQMPVVEGQRPPENSIVERAEEPVVERAEEPVVEQTVESAESPENVEPVQEVEQQIEVVENNVQEEIATQDVEQQETPQE